MAKKQGMNSDKVFSAWAVAIALLGGAALVIFSVIKDIFFGGGG